MIKFMLCLLCATPSNYYTELHRGDTEFHRVFKKYIAMDQNYRTIWIVSGEKCFAVFSKKEYAEEHKKTVVEDWEKSITMETILPSLNKRSEIEKHAKDYPYVIYVNKDHYELVKGASSSKEGTKEYWYYRLMSNADWDQCYENFVEEIIIEEHKIIK